MKLFDSVRDFFAPQEEDSFETEPVRESRDVRERREVRESFRETMREEEGSAREVRQPSPLRERTEHEYTPAKRDNKVVNIQATAASGRSREAGGVYRRKTDRRPSDLQENSCPESGNRFCRE